MNEKFLEINSNNIYKIVLESIKKEARENTIDSDWIMKFNDSVEKYRLKIFR